MAPSRRIRKRSTRMDAAVDAMGNLGFDAKVVTRVVRELLGIYGGDEAWPFIEEYGYKELIDALLRDSETSKDGNLEKECSGAGDFAQDVENNIVVKSPPSSACTNINNTGDMHLAIEYVNDSKETREYDSDEMTLIQRKRSNDTRNSSRRIEMAKNTPNAAGSSSLPSPKILKKRRVVTVKPSCEKNPGNTSSSHAPHALLPPSSPKPISPPRLPIRRRPCYGWIDSDDEDEPKHLHFPLVSPAGCRSQFS